VVEGKDGSIEFTAHFRLLALKRLILLHAPNAGATNGSRFGPDPKRLTPQRDGRAA